MEMIQVLNRLVGAFGPSGCENEVSQVIEELARPYVDEISRDVLGNLICHKRGSGPRVMFSAHMDSIGLVATHIDDKGFVRVGALGGVSAKEVVYTCSSTSARRTRKRRRSWSRLGTPPYTTPLSVRRRAV